MLTRSGKKATAAGEDDKVGAASRLRKLESSHGMTKMPYVNYQEDEKTKHTDESLNRLFLQHERLVIFISDHIQHQARFAASQTGPVFPLTAGPRGGAGASAGSVKGEAVGKEGKDGLKQN